MSAPANDPPRRSRPSVVKSVAEVVRGASAEALARPAGEVLANVAWDGAAPDAASVPAALFLGWL